MTTFDESMVDLKLLRLFEALYATRSVSRCAEQLGQSQPTVSIWLARLRELLNDPLFVRTSTGMQPTPRADELIGTCRDVLALVRQLSASEATFSPATAVRTFKMCMTDASHATLLPELYRRIALVAPNINLEAVRIDHTTLEKLQTGQADLALGFLPELDTGFYQQTLYQQDWVCVAREGHPRIRDSLTIAAFEQEQHIGISAGAGHQRLEQALAESGIVRHVRVRLPGFLGLPSLIGSSDLLATVPRLIGNTMLKAGGLRAFACPVELPTFPVKQHWHARYHHDAGNRWLRALSAQLFQHAEGIIE